MALGLSNSEINQSLTRGWHGSTEVLDIGRDRRGSARSGVRRVGGPPRRPALQGNVAVRAPDAHDSGHRERQAGGAELGVADSARGARARCAATGARVKHRHRLASRLRERGIHSTQPLLAAYERATGNIGVACSYRRARSETEWSRAMVWEHMDGRPMRTFIGKRLYSLPLAIQWARGAYSVNVWCASPFGRADLIPAEVIKWAEKFAAK